MQRLRRKAVAGRLQVVLPLKSGAGDPFTLTPNVGFSVKHQEFFFLSANGAQEIIATHRHLQRGRCWSLLVAAGRHLMSHSTVTSLSDETKPAAFRKELRLFQNLHPTCTFFIIPAAYHRTISSLLATGRSESGGSRLACDWTPLEGK